MPVDHTFQVPIWHDKPTTSSTVHPCSICGDSDHDYISPTFVTDGVRNRYTLCYTCAEEHEHEIGFCPDCCDTFQYPAEWGDWDFGCMSTVRCKEHSDFDDSPKIKCNSCCDPKDPNEIRWSMRGIPFCGVCWPSTVSCAAIYCQSRIYPGADNVVTTMSGSLSYCADCAVCRKPPISSIIGRPVHPLLWDYEAGCGCAMCSYLEGKHERWPCPVPTDAPTVGIQCSNCHNYVHLVVKPSEDEAFCHCCSGHLKKCTNCNMHRIQSDFQKIAGNDLLWPWAAAAAKGPVCFHCIVATDLMWYCDVSCKSWWPKAWECNCGGVHPWNYTPSTLNFMVGLREDLKKIHSTPRIWSVPFMGLELEIEAQKAPSSRAKGAKIVRDIMDSTGWVMHDGSLLGNKSNGTGGECGFEFVTHPFTYEWFNENWHRFEAVLKALSKEGYRSWNGGRCGMHIHISRAAMTDAHQMKFIRMVYGSTNLMLAVGQRGYRDPNLSKFAPFHGEDRSRLMEKIRHFSNPGVNGHYTALNTSKGSTIEARWFRGTLNPLGIRKNVELIHSMWYFTREYGHTSANEMNYITWLRQPWGKRHYGTLLNFIENNYITRR